MPVMGTIMCVLYKVEVKTHLPNGIVQGSLIYQSEFWQEIDGTLEQVNWGELNKGHVFTQLGCREINKVQV